MSSPFHHTHTWISWCLARKKRSQVEVVDEVCCPANSRPISIPAISSSVRLRPLLRQNRNWEYDVIFAVSASVRLEPPLRHKQENNERMEYDVLPKTYQAGCGNLSQLFQKHLTKTYTNCHVSSILCYRITGQTTASPKWWKHLGKCVNLLTVNESALQHLHVSNETQFQYNIKYIDLCLYWLSFIIKKVEQYLKTINEN